MLMREHGEHLKTISNALQTFLDGFEAWRTYQSRPPAAEASPEAVDEAVAVAKGAIEVIRETTPSLISPESNAALEAVERDVAAAEQDPAAKSAGAKKGFLRVAANALAAIAKPAVERVSSGIGKGTEKYAEAMTVAALTAIPAYASMLAGLVPSEFWFLGPVAAYLARVLGPTPSEKGDRRGDGGQSSDDDGE
ncbi:MAG: hypothetical protein AAFQ88_06665 [Pseudomonadota bacterium]